MEAADSSSTRRKTPARAHGTGAFRRLVASGPTAPLVLIVDDVEDTRMLYAETLAEAGFRVAEAFDGEHGLFKVGALTPSLIVMDISMPTLDGVEATRRLKADPGTATIPIVILSGHAQHLERAADAGADILLRKPCTPDELLAALRQILKIKGGNGSLNA
jgi:CheY-like chemotaxis protein